MKDRHILYPFNVESVRTFTDTESAEHFLLHCSRFQEATNKLQDTLDGISDSTARKKRLGLSDALLLAPKNDLVTRNYWIKEALFEFIANTQVKL